MNTFDTDLTKGQRFRMVSDLRKNGVNNQELLNAFERVPRHLFLVEDLRNFAYMLAPLDIGENQTISSPLTIAMQDMALDIIKGEKVLEIGTGCGYQTAILYEMGAKVYSIERFESLWKQGAENLQKGGYAPNGLKIEGNVIEVNENIHLLLGDGFNGWEDYAPYDKIIATCASPTTPFHLGKQLKKGGKMVLPVLKYDENPIENWTQLSEKEKITAMNGQLQFLMMYEKEDDNGSFKVEEIYRKEDFFVPMLPNIVKINKF